MTYQTGETITIKAVFKDASGNLADPAAAPVTKIYDSGENLVSGAGGTSTRISLGVYHYVWTLPLTKGGYYCEFPYTMEGKTSVKRIWVPVTFV